MTLAPILFTAEAYAIWRDKIEAAPHLMFDQILERFRSGADVKAADYIAGWRTLEAGRSLTWHARMAGFDAVICPTAPNMPPQLDRLMSDHDYYVTENLADPAQHPRRQSDGIERGHPADRNAKLRDHADGGTIGGRTACCASHAAAETALAMISYAAMAGILPQRFCSNATRGRNPAAFSGRRARSWIVCNQTGRNDPDD
jgi:hypothetical protein